MISKETLEKCKKLKDSLRTLDMKNKDDRITTYIRPNFDLHIKDLIYA